MIQFLVRTSQMQGPESAPLQASNFKFSGYLLKTVLREVRNFEVLDIVVLFKIFTKT